jgi:hypothetical protein
MIDLLNKLLASNTETEVLEFKKAERQFDKDKLGKYFIVKKKSNQKRNEKAKQ